MDNHLLLTDNFNYNIILPNTVQLNDDLINLNSEISNNFTLSDKKNFLHDTLSDKKNFLHDEKLALIDLDDIISLDRSNTIESNDILITKLDTPKYSNIIDIFQQKQEIIQNGKSSDIPYTNTLLNWQEQYIKYCELENLCNININYIINIKNNLINLLGYHEKDDIIFYQSIINNSIFYLSNSLKIRKIKFIKDLSNIWLKINDNYKHNKESNQICFQSLLKDYKKISDEINISKKTHKTLYWIKNDKIKNLQEFENLFTEILQYHLKLINSLLNLINHEKNFYCNT
jgi:hypothetical protein